MEGAEEGKEEERKVERKEERKEERMSTSASGDLETPSYPLQHGPRRRRFDLLICLAKTFLSSLFDRRERSRHAPGQSDRMPRPLSTSRAGEVPSLWGEEIIPLPRSTTSTWTSF